MESVFHVRANTAEELREELVTWLEREIERRTGKLGIAKLVRDQAKFQARIVELRDVLDFWRRLNIDSRS